MGELIVGIAVMAVVGVVVARLFLALLSTAQYTLRHLAALSSARKAYAGDGGHRGMSWGLQEASGLVSLSTAGLSLNLPAVSTLTYSVSAETLTASEAGIDYALAKGVSSMTATYYNIAASGLIMESTAADTASLACVHAVAAGAGKKKTYDYYSCGWLRNK